MTKNLRTVLLALATSAAVAVPLAGYAFAQTSAGPAQTMNQTQAQKEGPEGTEAAEGTEANEAPAYTGSIQLPADKGGAEVPDAQEQAQLQALARITPDQAKQAALAAVPGTVTSVMLGDENGSLVYEVLIGKTDVKVDAGNGKVLHQEAADSESGESEGTEAGETGG
ncbi:MULTISPECIES: PepSY domain-containing protein [Deinococcus]|uniref:PepSY domain-containing protein n=1 Tax=Deinococcus rufus TaxID=2136097 RepID=A0ABV7Z7B4_9DEIO|nr:PepSY domain-containing protein [Deinococcus sp. AB2017081]WQE97207.1 PepSY domain-containing protein [Deinococcus sp. AB2017081]